MKHLHPWFNFLKSTFHCKFRTVHLNVMLSYSRLERLGRMSYLALCELAGVHTQLGTFNSVAYFNLVASRAVLVQLCSESRLELGILSYVVGVQW